MVEAESSTGQTFAHRPVIAVVAMGTMLAPLNSTMIAVAVTDVMADFDVELSRAGWLVTAYLIGMASLQPVAGRIGDLIGRRRLILGGLAVFGLVSLAASLAPNLWALIAFRTLQAVAGALIIPNGAAIVREVVPWERRGQTFGLIGAVVGIAAASGPPIGGLLVDAAGWRAMFTVNLAIVVPALVLGWRTLPRDQGRPTSGNFDTAGAFLLPLVLIGVTALLVLLSQGIPAFVAGGGLAAVVALGVLFVWREARHPQPVLRVDLFRRRNFTSACLGIGLGNMAMYTVLLSVPLLLASRSGFSTLETGLVLTSMSAAMILVAPLGGRLADRAGRRTPTLAGLGILTAGSLVITLAGVDIAVPTLIAGLLLVGTGIGLATPGLQTSAVESVDSRDAGIASGLYSTSRYLGSITGSVILVALLGAKGDDVGGLGTVFLLVLVAASLSVVGASGMKGRPAAGTTASGSPRPCR